jgi:hypothetical protein
VADRGRHNGRGNADTALVAALAAGSTRQEAALAAGVSQRTVARRLEDPAFRCRVEDAQHELLSCAVSRLSAASNAAVDTLTSLLASDLASARLGASRAILEFGVKLREHQNLDHRIRALEETASVTNGGGTHG